MPANDSVSLFHLNDKNEMIEYGIAYFSLACPLIPLFSILIKTIRLKDREVSNISYKLMNIVNLCQFGQVISHFISGPMLIFPQIHRKIDVIIRIIGCIMNSLWIADFPVMTLLALCRVLIFSNVIGSKKYPLIIRIMLAAIGTWTVFLIVVGSITQNIVLVTPGWDYDLEAPKAETFARLEVILSFACLVLSYFLYLLMAYMIYAKKNMVSCVHSRKNEIAILLQSTFVTTYITIMILIWHQALFSNVSIIDMENERNQAILNCCLILHCYVNPILTFICNKTIREDCLKLLGFRKRTRKQSEIVSKLSSIHPSDPNQI